MQSHASATDLQYHVQHYLLHEPTLSLTLSKDMREWCCQSYAKECASPAPAISVLVPL